MRELKKRILEEQQGVLQQLKAQQAQLENRINTLDHELGRVSAHMLEDQKKGTTVMKILGYSMQIDSLRLQIQELSEQLEEMGRKVEAQTEVVVAANQEVSKLDKLEDKQYEDYLRQEQKEEELRIEEIVVQGIGRKGQESR